MKYQKIFIAADHAGLPLKKALIEMTKSLPWQDLGTNDEASVDYPDYAEKLVTELTKYYETQKKTDAIGVLICGSGQGMAIKANRNPKIRAALCWTPEVAQMARSHNNANVLCLGARFIEPTLALNMLNEFLNTEFEGGRHERRVAKLS